MMGKSESGLQEKDLDFNFNEEQIFKDSFPNSPFIVQKQTPFFEKKFSQLLNQCRTPRKSINGGNSVVAQHTPVNPWNQYLMGKEHVPSPFGVRKGGDFQKIFPKSICETPENLQFKKGFKEMDLQKFLYSGTKDILGRMMSSQKINQNQNSAAKKKSKNNMNFSFNSGVNSINLVPRENKENNSLYENSASKIRHKLRTNTIQYDSEFSKENILQKNPFSNINPQNNQYPILMNKDIQSKKIKNIGCNQITSQLNISPNIIKPKKLFETEHNRNPDSSKKMMIENMQDFFEKSYSKIMETTPQNSKQNNNGLGMLLYNAMNNIKVGSQVNKNPLHKLRSQDSMIMHNYPEKKSAFGESKK